MSNKQTRLFLQKCVLKRQRNHENAVSKLVAGSGEQGIKIEVSDIRNIPD